MSVCRRLFPRILLCIWKFGVSVVDKLLSWCVVALSSIAAVSRGPFCALQSAVAYCVRRTAGYYTMVSLGHPVPTSGVWLCAFCGGVCGVVGVCSWQLVVSSKSASGCLCNSSRQLLSGRFKPSLDLDGPAACGIQRVSKGAWFSVLGRTGGFWCAHGSVLGASDMHLRPHGALLDAHGLHALALLCPTALSAQLPCMQPSTHPPAL